jgi:CDP-glycerol glycerophosphotransferase (TagB/SpsB family)
MAKVAVFIDHDIIIRHFLLNGFLQQLESQHDLTFIFPKSHRRVKTEPQSLNLKSYRLIEIDEERVYLLRRLYQHHVLRNARTGLNKKFLYEFWKEALGRRTFIKTWINSFPVLYSLYKRKTLRKIGRNLALDQLLKEIEPDVIVHPTVLEGLFASDLIAWGKENKIPTIYLMNSWDNPSTKAMTLGHPDWLVVWGEQSKMHANVHLKMDKDRILTFGAAQFEIYRHPPSMTSEEFKKKLEIDAGAKIILYAGSSKQVKEVQHLIELEKAIEEGRLPPCYIVFRPHPWRGVVEGEVDFFSRSWKWVMMDPSMKEYYVESRKDSGKIYLPDINYTHTILSACDMLISPVSTILLEAALHDKPILAFLPEEDIDKNFFLRTMNNMIFMQEFFKKMECGPILTMDELIDKTRHILLTLNDHRISEICQKASYFVVSDPKGYLPQLNELISRVTSRERDHVAN